MKTILIVLLMNAPVGLFGQNKTLAHTWYVENNVVNNLKKTTITLTLDSITRKVGDNIHTEIYRFQNDSSYYQSMWSVPENPTIGMLSLPGYGTYCEGKWELTSPDHLVLTNSVNYKSTKRVFTVQWISERKILLTEM